MGTSMSIDAGRRRFLKYSALGGAWAACPRWVSAETLRNAPTAGFHPDVELDFTAKLARVEILNQGPETAVQKFFGTVRKGPANSLVQLPNNYLGPILNLQQGQKVRVYFTNQLSEATIIHWHGLHVPQSSDGHPMYTIAPGEQYVYEFEVRNPAGTSFYHSHAHNLTAEQVYRGLSGLIVVRDVEEAKLDLPDGDYDLPLVIQDRNFDNRNQLRYVHCMPQRMMGFLGDTILVNGKPNAGFQVKSRAYRFRALNGSNSRIYKLGWDDGTPLTAIATDAGLLARPETRPYLMLAPGERIDLWLDFSGRAVGSKLTLYSLPYRGAMPAMYERMGHGGMMHGGIHQGAKFPIAVFEVTEKVSDSPKLPEKLVPFRRLTAADTDNADSPLPIALSMQPMRPLLNGMSFAMDRVVEAEKVPLGSIKKIRIFHDHPGGGHRGGMGMMGGMRHGGDADPNPEHDMGGMGGAMMNMAHPIHLHGQQYQILSRHAADTDGYASVKDGFIDSGWKDTVLVMPGEVVEIAKPFQDYKGLFLYHCHNLEHEDLGMMRQFYVY